MEEREITSVATLISICKQIAKGFGETNYWYRGQASASWGLVPSVHRSYDSAGEHNLAARFRLGAPIRYSRTPALDDNASWICLMQHFGLPTRLLDWSSSPLIALYFALESERESGDAAVWLLVPSELNRKSRSKVEHICVLTGPEADPLLRAAINQGEQVNDVLAVMGQELDLRMTVQQGAYTIHGTDMPLERRPGISECLAKLVIPKESKKSIRKELWFLGIRRAGLFPDLANLAQDLATDHRLIPPRIDVS